MVTDASQFSLKKDDKLDEKFKKITDWMYMMNENWRFASYSLGPENFSEVSMQEISSAITEPVYDQIKNVQGSLSGLKTTAEDLLVRVGDTEADVMALAKTAEGMQLSVTNLQGDLTNINADTDALTTRLVDAEGNISTLTQTASDLLTRTESAEGNISSLTQTSSGVTARLVKAEGAITALETTTGGLQLGVKTAAGSSGLQLYSNDTALGNVVGLSLGVNATGSSSGNASLQMFSGTAALGDPLSLGLSVTNNATNSILKLMAGETILSSAEINITGVVTFSDLSTNKESTVINGSNIRTGIINADLITAGNINASLIKNGVLNALMTRYGYNAESLAPMGGIEFFYYRPADEIDRNAGSFSFNKYADRDDFVIGINAGSFEIDNVMKNIDLNFSCSGDFFVLGSSVEIKANNNLLLCSHGSDINVQCVQASGIFKIQIGNDVWKFDSEHIYRNDVQKV